MPKNIEAHFDITHRILNEGIIESFLHSLSTFDGGRWQPERYNNASPVKHVYSTSAIDRIAEKWRRDNIGMILKRLSSPKYDLDFTGERSRLLVKNQLTVYFDTSLFRTEGGVGNCLAFLNKVYETFTPVYGYAVHRNDYLRKNRLVTRGNNDSTIETWVGRDLSKSLRGIYWANWFGPIYVDFFGKDRFEGAVFNTVQLGDGGYLILTAPDPLGYAREEVRKTEDSVRAHLGADAFYDINQPNRPTRSPWGSRFIA